MRLEMKCLKCRVTFDPAKKAEIVKREFGLLEVQTKCPSCGSIYYSHVAVWFPTARKGKK